MGRVVPPRNPHTYLNPTEYTSTAIEIENSMVFLCPNIYIHENVMVFPQGESND